MKQLLGVVVCLFVVRVVGAVESLSMDDLMALVASSSWSEVLAKADRIPPAKRTPDWQKAITQAAKSELQGLNIDANAYEAFDATETAIRKYDFLRSDAQFVSLRNEVGRKVYNDCFHSTKYHKAFCRDEYLAFIAFAKQNAQGALDAALIVESFMTDSYAMAFYDVALQGKNGKSHCSAKGLDKAVLDALKLDGAKFPEVAMAQKATFEACWSVLGAKVKEVMAEDELMLRNTCAGMLKRGGLKGIKLKKCKRLAGK